MTGRPNGAAAPKSGPRCRAVLFFVVALLPAIALADIAGTASVIDGDTLEVR